MFPAGGEAALAGHLLHGGSDTHGPRAARDGPLGATGDAQGGGGGHEGGGAGGHGECRAWGCEGACGEEVDSAAIAAADRELTSPLKV
jgi:hypothetical protein